MRKTWHGADLCNAYSVDDPRLYNATLNIGIAYAMLRYGSFMEHIHFITANWYLFVALVVVSALLSVEPIKQLIYRVQSVTPTEVVSLINHRNAVVVDVRDSKDFHAGHIIGAINLPSTEFTQRVGELEKHKKRPIVVSCQMGQRAGKSAALLRKHGFESVSIIAGGMNAWERSQLPVAK